LKKEVNFMLIHTKNLSLYYQDGLRVVHAVDRLNIELPERGLYGIIGPSGSGKTSILYLLSGLKRQTDGEIFYEDAPYPRSTVGLNNLRRKEMGFVFQSHFLIEYLNVIENILVGADDSYAASDERIDYLIQELGITELVDRKIDQLSGGQRQLVTIARALANNPKIIFVDEPTSSLDHVTGKKVIQLLEKISKQACVVLVTHDETNLVHADKIFSIWDGKVKA
jgi:putative ABC transport system ATP-binding protein